MGHVDAATWLLAGSEFHIHPEDTASVGAAPKGGRGGKGVGNAQFGQGRPGLQGTAQGVVFHQKLEVTQTGGSCTAH